MDFRTAFLGHMLTSLLSALVMTSLWRHNRHRLQGLGLWAIEFWMQALALALILLRGVIPDFLSMVIANTLVPAGLILLLMGLERFLGVWRSHFHNYVYLAIFAGIHIFFSFVQPSLAGRNINGSIALIFLLSQGIWLLTRRVKAELNHQTHGITVILAAYVIAALIRIVGALTTPQAQSMASSGPVDTLVIFTYQVLAISLTFALVLFVNRRLAHAMEQDIAARAQAEAEMRDAVSEARRFRQALDGVPAYIYIKDKERRTVYANLPLLNLLGTTETEMLGTDGTQFFPPETAAKLKEIDRRVIDEGEQSAEEVEFSIASGERRVFWEINTPLHENGQSGEIWGLCGVATDITERKLAEDEVRHLNAELEMRVQERTERLQQANERLSLLNRELIESNILLEEATRAKNDFLAAMSHELRTPLNSIIGFSTIMLQGFTGDLTPEQDKQLGMINRSGRHLLELINEVLDLAKVESGASAPTITEFDLRHGVSEMIDTVRPMAAARDLDLQVTYSDDVAVLRTDGLFVNQIVLNLLSNAIKFTEHGHIRVAVVKDDDGASISVEDSGCGVSPEELAHIFEDFYQVVPSVVAKSEGTGLGLALSRRLAELIGARITVSSEPGQGSTFTLHVPNIPV